MKHGKSDFLKTLIVKYSWSDIAIQKDDLLFDHENGKRGDVRVCFLTDGSMRYKVSLIL